MTVLIGGAMIIVPIISSAQSPNDNYWNHWYMGLSAGINFNGAQVNVDSGNTLNYAKAISDPTTGELLFYSNGKTVVDRNHNQMPNGIMHWSTITESNKSICEIIPLPGNDDLFILLTIVSDTNNTLFYGDLYYSVVDMNLNGGNGDISATKNVHLADSVFRYWVTRSSPSTDEFHFYIREFGNNSMLQFRLTPDSGLIKTPIVHQVGPVINWFPNGQESMDVNRQGNVLVILFQGLTHLLILDEVSGYPVGNITLNTQAMSGVEFSPNGEYLYCSRATNTTPFVPHQIHVYELSSWDPTTILASEYLLPGTANLPVGQMTIELAPNGQMLVAINGGLIPSSERKLSVITDPDLGSTGSGFSFESIDVTRTCWRLPFNYPIYDEPNSIVEVESVQISSLFPNPSTGSSFIRDGRLQVLDCINALGQRVSFTQTGNRLDFHNTQGVIFVSFRYENGLQGWEQLMVLR